MTKLINKDVLKAYVYQYFSFHRTAKQPDIDEMIDNQPTVEAIPVKWIEKYAEGFEWDTLYDAGFRRNIRTMIDVYRHTEEGK